MDESEASRVVRGGRAGASRACRRPFGSTRLVTVIVGPHDGDACVLFTAYGGPLAPREPWDPTLDDAGRAESEAFWADHALTVDPE